MYFDSYFNNIIRICYNFIGKQNDKNDNDKLNDIVSIISLKKKLYMRIFILGANKLIF